MVDAFDTVSESQLALYLPRESWMAIFHRIMIQKNQTTEADKGKCSQSGILWNPSSRTQEQPRQKQKYH